MPSQSCCTSIPLIVCTLPDFFFLILSSVYILLTILFARALGEYDHLPEVAFYMVGDIGEAVAKAERLAEEVQ